MKREVTEKDLQGVSGNRSLMVCEEGENNDAVRGYVYLLYAIERLFFIPRHK